MKDIIIIGAGVVGAHIARELSVYNADILLLEKNHDVCEETSKANSGIVHSGYDATPGTLKAKFNVLGNKMMQTVCEELSVPFKQNGSLIIGYSDEDKGLLHELMQQGKDNGVESLELIDKNRLFELEPNLNKEAMYALYAPTGGIVDPFQLTIAAAEVAYQNNVVFQFDTEVTNIIKTSNGYKVITNQGEFESKIVVNAAGVYSDEMNNFVSQRKLTIHPRKGEYLLFDKQVGSYVNRTIFQLPSSKGKGVLVTPTAEGNLLIGPSSVYVTQKEDTSTTVEGIQYVIEKGNGSISSIPMAYVITGFAGLRASEEGKDFVIGEVSDAPGFYNAAGIESPGLTAAPAIGKEIARLIKEKYQLHMKSEYVCKRPMPKRFEEESIEGKRALIEADKEYGKIICRCEMIPLAEIKAAIHRPLGATTLDGVKRRTRAGSGRCQGGFCSPKIMDILAEELHIDHKEVAKFNEQSTFLIGLDKEI